MVLNRNIFSTLYLLSVSYFVKLIISVAPEPITMKVELAEEEMLGNLVVDSFFCLNQRLNREGSYH